MESTKYVKEFGVKRANDISYMEKTNICAKEIESELNFI